MADEPDEPDDVDRDIGLRLRAAGTISALTLEQLGAAVQISGEQLSTYELGGNRVGASGLPEPSACRSTISCRRSQPPTMH